VGSLGLVAVGTATVSTLLTWALVSLLKRRRILDVPNERSLHSVPTPRGGGWAILVAFALGSACLGSSPDRVLVHLPLIGGTLALLAVSWRDDRRPVGPLPRLAAQVIAVAVGMSTLRGQVFQGWLPPSADYGLAAFAWVWFINLFNFMDGMDGLAGGEALAVGGGLFLMAPEQGQEALILAAAVLGFLVWNWAPAKLFLGDVGSIPLGYLLGAMLLRAAERGFWVASLLLPLYFLADATLTLLRRLVRREKVWRAHREHFYQRAVQSGRSHGRVALAVMVTNGALIVCAVGVAPTRSVLALASGAATVAILIAWMSRRTVLA
jgi:UDP-N-acetylmuramyl pentapeptide phosphotransferase/UDP-N-acetylglucosamine-1-phosphate transferase